MSDAPPPDRVVPAGAGGGGTGQQVAGGFGPAGEQLLTLLPQALAVVDGDGVLVDGNPSLAELCELTLREVVGRRLDELADGSAERVGQLLRRWRGSAGWRPAGFTLLAGRDEPIELVAEGARLRGTDLVLLRLVERHEAVGDFRSLTRDLEVHNLREMETRLQASLQELAEANQRLEAVNAELERYTSMVAHDIRTPFNAIQRFAELLLEDDEGVPGPAREMVEAIGRLADRGQQVTEALLSLARIGAPDAHDAPVTDSVETARGAVEQLRRDIDEAEAEVVVAGDLPPVAVDPVHLTQLLTNLVGNGLKYAAADRPPRVEIRARPEEGRVRFTVSDNGLGVEPQERERIFDPLVRGSAGAGRPGSGVGLATCRRIVESYGGTIAVVPDEGPGATFEFDLPAASGVRAGRHTGGGT